MKPLVQIVLLVRALCLSGGPSANHQNQSDAIRLKPAVSSSKQTQNVSCWNKKNRLTGSRLVRTPVLISPDGSHRAYVEVEATAFQPKDVATYIGNLCENTSRLFFAKNGETTFKLAFTQSPEDFSDGNSLTLVDWSTDGMHLLMERTQWKYESEGDYTDFVVFNVGSGTVARPNLEAAIAARYGKDCGSENSATGFTSDGKVVVAIAPLADDVALMNGAMTCVKKKTLVVVNFGSGATATIEEPPPNLNVVRYGRFAESAPKPQSMNCVPMLSPSPIVAKYPPNAKPGFNSPEEVTSFLEKRWTLADIKRYAIPERRHNDEYQNLVIVGFPETWTGRLYCDKSTGFDSIEWYATIEIRHSKHSLHEYSLGVIRGKDFWLLEIGSPTSVKQPPNIEPDFRKPYFVGHK